MRFKCKLCGRSCAWIRYGLCRGCNDKVPTIDLVDDVLPETFRKDLAARIDKYTERAKARTDLFEGVER